jgi:hypothetical protein
MFVALYNTLRKMFPKKNKMIRPDLFTLKKVAIQIFRKLIVFTFVDILKILVKFGKENKKL